MLLLLSLSLLLLLLFAAAADAAATGGCCDDLMVNFFFLSTLFHPGRIVFYFMLLFVDVLPCFPIFLLFWMLLLEVVFVMVDVVRY